MPEAAFSTEWDATSLDAKDGRARLRRSGCVFRLAGGVDSPEGGFGIANMRRVLAILLENEAGALSRVVGLFAQRNYNIETLNVAPTDDATLSRVTLTTQVADAARLEQITKHLNRLIEVVKVVVLREGEHVERELMLVKVRAQGDAREALRRTCDEFRGQIIDVTEDTCTLQLADTSEKIDACVRALDGVAILEVVRSGVSGIGQGENILSL